MDISSSTPFSFANFLPSAQAKRSEGALRPMEQASPSSMPSTTSSVSSIKRAQTLEDATPAVTQKSSDSKNILEQTQAEKRQQQQIELVEQREIQRLSARDREVRNHEQAHAAVGGQYAGAPRYQYERGPDGINYAIGGEVSISTSPMSGDPRATIEKAQIIRRAALAPAEPSPQDRRVAAEASKMEMQARAELMEQQREQLAGVDEQQPITNDTSDSEQQSGEEQGTASRSRRNEQMMVAIFAPQPGQQLSLYA